VRKVIPVLVGLIVLASCLAGTQAETSDESDASPAVQLTVMSQDLLEGVPVGHDAKSLHVQGDLRALEGSNGDGVYQELFRVDTGAADSIAPASELEKIGIVPVGQTTYTLPDGTVGEYSFGLARIEFMGEMREGRIIFGPEDVAPVLGLSALESIGFTIDPATQTLRRVSPTDGSGQQ
jgi:predicted aspartyl protease